MNDSDFGMILDASRSRYPDPLFVDAYRCHAVRTLDWCPLGAARSGREPGGHAWFPAREVSFLSPLRVPPASSATRRGARGDSLSRASGGTPSLCPHFLPRPYYSPLLVLPLFGVVLPRTLYPLLPLDGAAMPRIFEWFLHWQSPPDAGAHERSSP